MSNSIKHHPFAAYCGGSNSIWKRTARRELRRTNKQLLRTGKELRIMREESNLYDSPQDGTVHFVTEACRKIKIYRPRGLRILLTDAGEWWKPKVFRK